MPPFDNASEDGTPTRVNSSVALRALLRRGLRAAACVGFASAFLASGRVNADPLVDQVNQRIEVDATPFLFNYREYQGQPKQILDRDSSVLPGVSISAADIVSLGQTQERLFGLVRYDYSRGGAHHYGQSLTGGPPLNYTAGEELSQTLVEIGSPVAVRSKLLIIPLVELEYRDWRRSLPRALLSMQEHYTFFAPGAGARATYALSQRVALSAKVGLEYTVAPQNYGNANPAIGSPAAAYRLGERPVYQVEGDLQYVLSRRLSIRLGGTYSRFGFGQSQSVPFVEIGGKHTTELEPQSTTDEGIVRLGLAYSI